jgi:hypothetical protein
MTDDQLRTQMDRKGISYFKMSDQDMRRSWLPLETERAQNRPAALFTGDNPNAAPAISNFDQTLNTALQMVNTFLKDPGKWGPEYLQGASTLLTHLAQTKEFGPSAEATREYQRQHGNLLAAQAGAIPDHTAAQNEELRSRASHYRGQGPMILNPGQLAIQPSENLGGPATEIGRGLTEKAGTPGSIQHDMSESHKVMYNAAAHIASTALPGSTEQKDAFNKMNMIESLYNKPNVPRSKMVWGETEKRLKATGKYTDKEIEEFKAREGF